MRFFYQVLFWLSDRINRLIEWALFGLGLTMALLIGLQVFFRYGLNHSLFWSEELGRMFLVWLTFLGATVAYKRQAHIGIDFLVLMAPPKFRKCLQGIVLVGSMVFFWIITQYGFQFFHFIRFQRTSALGISK
ncbi:MAG: TRAP transporter small permease, partial [Deltaproteobacteria bacterium]|nr:TRAP transporter small permease [Deltaproteobacteria bacterium]